MSQPLPVFIGFVAPSGKLELDHRPDFIEHVKSFAGYEVELTIRRRRAKRSLDQNAFWWAVPVPILAEHCGYTASQMHYALLGECFGYVPGPTGQPMPVKPSSSDLSVEEFTHLIEWVQMWAMSELGCHVPSPGEVTVPA